MSKAPNPTDCVSVDTHEARLTALADDLEVKARALFTGDARIGLATAKEFALAAIRARKQASELALARELRAHDMELVRAAREMSGIRSARPLRRKS